MTDQNHESIVSLNPEDTADILHHAAEAGTVVVPNVPDHIAAAVVSEMKNAGGEGSEHHELGSSHYQAHLGEVAINYTGRLPGSYDGRPTQIRGHVGTLLGRKFSTPQEAAQFYQTTHDHIKAR